MANDNEYDPNSDDDDDEFEPVTPAQDPYAQDEEDDNELPVAASATSGKRTMTREELLAAGGEEVSAGPRQKRTMTREELMAAGGREVTPTTAGVIARGLAEGAVPGAAAGVGGLYAAGQGALIGGAVGNAPGAIIGGIVGGLGGGALAGYVAQKGQDWFLNALGLRDNQSSLNPFNKEQAETDIEEHPWLATGARMAPALAGMSPSAGAGTMVRQLATRGIGGAVGGAAGAGLNYIETGQVDIPSTVLGAAAGAAFPGVNRYGKRIMEAGSGRKAVAPPTETPPEGTPGESGPVEDTLDITPGGAREAPPVKPGAADKAWEGKPWGISDDEFSSYLTNEDVRVAAEQRDQFTPDDPMYKFWDDHLNNAMLAADDKAAPASEYDPSLGPRGKDNPFTPADSDLANDIPITSVGIATENGPTKEVFGAGNPEGVAPMKERVAARPDSPERDYRKDQPAPAGEGATQDSVPMSTSPVHEDIMSAMAADNPAPPAPEPAPVPAPVQAALPRSPGVRPPGFKPRKPTTPVAPEPTVEENLATLAAK